MSEPSLRSRRSGALFVLLTIGLAATLGFRLPLERVVGVIEPAPDDWTSPEIGGVLAIGCGFLGLSAALARKRRGRLRREGVVAGVAVASGFAVAALGVFLHEMWLLVVGYGVLGGGGLGLGWTASLTLLIQSLGGRRRLAWGLALTALGGGALLAAPLAGASIDWFASLASAGVWETFLVLGTATGSALVAGALLFYRPADPSRRTNDGKTGP